jgi:hypothetical protein
MINTYETFEGKHYNYDSPGFVFRSILSEFNIELTPNQVERMMLILDDLQILDVKMELALDETGWF